MISKQIYRTKIPILLLSKSISRKIRREKIISKSSRAHTLIGRSKAISTERKPSNRLLWVWQIRATARVRKSVCITPIKIVLRRQERFIPVLYLTTITKSQKQNYRITPCLLKSHIRAYRNSFHLVLKLCSTKIRLLFKRRLKREQSTANITIVGRMFFRRSIRKMPLQNSKDSLTQIWLSKKSSLLGSKHKQRLNHRVAEAQ